MLIIKICLACKKKVGFAKNRIIYKFVMLGKQLRGGPRESPSIILVTTLHTHTFQIP